MSEDLTPNNFDDIEGVPKPKKTDPVIQTPETVAEAQAEAPAAEQPFKPEKKKIDWLAAKNFYVSNPTVTYEQVAEQFDAPLKTVKYHGAKENWAELRLELGQKVSNAIEGEVIQQSVDRNEVHALGARNLQSLIQKKLAIANEKMDELLEKQANGEKLSPYEKGIVSDKGLSELANAYVTAVNLERVTQGLPTSVERKEITGSGGTDLFGTGNKEKFIALMADTIAELSTGGSEQSVPERNTGSQGQS